jgi:hypothetical protein
MSKRMISRLRSMNGLPVIDAEFLGHLLLPLLDETARRHNQAAFKIAADQKFLDEEAGHDRLAGSRVVSQQKSQRLAREHFPIDGRDLMRQSFDL